MTSFYLRIKQIGNIYPFPPVHFPVEFGFGMGDKKIRTALCPGGRERMSRLLRLLENGRIDPTPLTTNRFPFV
jgi:threonine dehydrogenase-like Zn-dependent dehydrogenase